MNPAKVTAAALLIAATASQPGCETTEAALCRDASDKICDKWFSCFPVISAGIWGTTDGCFVRMRDWCTHSEVYTGCDIDDQMLRQCRDGIDGSACGSLPPACRALLDCYQANPSSNSARPATDR